jgi:hemerythrin superfamily protein
MDVTELLKQDHEKLSKLFVRMEALEDFYERREIFQEIKDVLEVHTYLIEAHFYPLLQDKAEFEELIEEALEDQQEIDLLLEEMDSIEEDPDRFDDRLGELIDCVQSHIELEEDEIFPKLAKAFSELELEQMGTTLFEAKKASEAAA